MVLLVVDTQNLIMSSDLYEFQIVKKNIKALINEARCNGIEVIFVRHDDGSGKGLTKGTIDFEIYDEFKPEHGEIILIRL